MMVPTELLDQLKKGFNEAELRAFCLGFEIDYEGLEGASKDAKALALIGFFQRRGQYSELVEKVIEQRPHLNSRKSDQISPQTTTGPVFPIFEIPFRRNPNFTGRTEALTEIDRNLTTDGSGIKVQAVTGMGGVGKTQLTAEYAYRNADAYDLVWWITAETEETLTTSYFDLAQQLQLPVKTGADQTVFVNITKNWLENTSRSWLLIFDNAESPERLQSLLPRKGNGQAIITSRNPNWGELAHVLTLSPFLLEESRDFLLDKTADDDKDAAEEVAELLGGLPLAMAQAIAYINERRTPLKEYATLYQSERKKIWEREKSPRGYEATVATAWELSFQQINQNNSTAIELLNLCSILHPDDIPLSIIIDGAAVLPENLQLATENRLDLNDVIEILVRYSLIERRKDSLSIHRVLQDVTRDGLNHSRLQDWLTIALSLLKSAFSFDKFDLETWAISTRLLPHIFAVNSLAKKHNLPSELSADLYQSSGELLRIQGDFPAAETAVEHALALRRELLDEEHPAIAESLDFLGELQQDQANYEQANICHQQAFSLRQKSLEEKDPNIASSLNNLGLLLQAQGQYQKAKPYYEKALAIRTEVLGENHPDTATSLNNLGALLQAQGQYQKVKPYYEKALAIYTEVLGENHPHTATSLNNLGALLQAQGQYEQAISYIEKALAIHTEVLGENHPKTAGSLNNLGHLLQAQGQYEQAQPYYEKALAIRTVVLGENHPDTALSLNNLGTLNANLGKYVVARKHLEQTLAIYERTYPRDNHPSFIKVLTSLGSIMLRLKQYSKARQYITRALKICESTNEQYADCEEVFALSKSAGLVRKKKNGKKRKKR